LLSPVSLRLARQAGGAGAAAVSRARRRSGRVRCRWGTGRHLHRRVRSP